MKVFKIVLATLAIIATVQKSNAQWSLSGNSITPSEFIGTTNVYPFRLKQNNTTLGVFQGGNTVLLGNLGADNNFFQENTYVLGHNISNDDSAPSGNAFAIGRNLFIDVPNTFTLGFGYGNATSTQMMHNSIENSLMIGFNSNIPTFFVGPSSGLNTTGNVGVGTTSPVEKLHVNGALLLGSTTSTNAGTLRYTGTDFEGYVGGQWKSLTAQGSGASQWTTSGSNITYSLGNVGIGFTTPLHKLTVNGQVTAVNGQIGFTHYNNATYDNYLLTYYDNSIFSLRAGQNNGVNPSLALATGGFDRLTITPSGNIGIGMSNPTNLLTVNATLTTSQAKGISLRANESVFADFIATGPTYNSYGVGANQIWLNSQGGDLNIGPASSNSIKFVNGGTEKMRIASNGYVGIGTNNPVAKLQVAGGGVIIGNATLGQRWVIDPRSAAGSDYFMIVPDDASGAWDFTKQFGIQRSTGKVFIGDMNTNYQSLNTTGDYRLYVRGGILTEKVKIALYNTASWADYVFEDSYNLMSLADVEAYIKQNKHLPGVPSAEEVVQNGVEVVDMQATLLKKIEELTLYILEQNKRIESLEKSQNLGVNSKD